MRTDIGHFAIEQGETRYELIPSFKNIRSICEPEEMPVFFANLFGKEINEHLTANEGKSNALANEVLLNLLGNVKAMAALVIQCCCELDTSKLTGYPQYTDKGRAWIDGAMHSENIIHIARSMLTHGVTGKFDPDNRAQRGKATDKVDVYRYVEMAIAHLGLSPEKAENLTKTEFDRLIDAKFPDAKKGGNDAPTLSEHEQAMDWLDKVNERREAAKASA